MDSGPSVGASERRLFSHKQVSKRLLISVAWQLRKTDEPLIGLVRARLPNRRISINRGIFHEKRISSGGRTAVLLGLIRATTGGLMNMSITRRTSIAALGNPTLLKSTAALPRPGALGRMSTHKIELVKYISSAAVSLCIALLTGCYGVTIDKPADKSTNVNNPVAASISLRSYCNNFHVTLDGTDVTNQFTSPNVSPATAVFNNLPAGQHTLYASAYTDIPCSGGVPSGASSTFTVSGPSFALSGSPNPLNLIRKSSQSLTISVTPSGGFTGTVNVAISGLPMGATATPATITTATSGTTIIAADATAGAGSTNVTLNGTSGSVTGTGSFKLEVTPPSITSINPILQARGGTVDVTGTNFDATTCSNNVVSLGTTTAAPTSCTSTSLKFSVPTTAPFGGQLPVTVSTSGLGSNSKTLTISRQTGNFVEITSAIEGKVANLPCSTGAVQLNVCGPNCPGSAAPYVATFKKTGGAQIGQSQPFHLNNTRVAQLGGAGFSLCSIGVVLDGDATGFSPQLMGIIFLDLGSGQTFPPGGDYTFNYGTPNGTSSYVPRIFQSPDGTLIIVVTASTIGPSQLTAAVFDAIHPNNPPSTSCQSQTVSTVFSASVTSANQISASLAGTACTVPIQ
jgi:hypothetical protein